MTDLMPRPVDQPARQQALDPSKSFIVQAPAGSGKTEMLIQRILALLAKVQAPEEILAITFTRKAAGEMKTRLLDALAAARDPQPPDKEHARQTWDLARSVLQQDREKAWGLAGNPSRLQIMTIDSLCASLTRRMPWLSRFGAQPEITDDPGEYYRRAAERLLDRIETGGEEGRAALHLLRHLDNRLDTLRDMLVDMLSRRDQWLRHLLGRDAETRTVLEDSLAAFLEGNLAVVHELLGVNLRAELHALVRYAIGHLEDGPLVDTWSSLTAFPPPVIAAWPSWEALLDLLLTRQDLVRNTVTRAQGFPPGHGEPAAMKARMKSLLETLAADEWMRTAFVHLRSMPRSRYHDRQWEILDALINLLPSAALALQQVFREAGKVDFIEIAGAAQVALGAVDQPEDLLLQLDSTIRHILVDEFQDTSHGQYFLLEKLTGGWSPDDGRTVFVVGDPMQSIYRFREADVGLYLRTRRTGLTNVHLEPLRLEANFRSQDGVVGWVNHTFSKLFPALPDEPRGAVPYAPAVAVHQALPGDPVTVTAYSGRQDEAEARYLVDQITQCLTERPDDTIAILVRSRNHLPQIIGELKARGLRFQAQEIDPLADRPTVQDLRALARALVHADDRISWLAILRAPWCGLQLNDLLDICEPSATATIRELLQQFEEQGRLFDHPQDDRAERVARFCRVMDGALTLKGRISLRRMVETAWLGLGGPACISPRDLQDARQVLELLDTLDDGGDLPRLELLDEKLAKLYAAPDNEASEQLQVMTIHKAKGLEFDTVFLPGLGRAVRVGSRGLLRWQELPDDHLLLAPIPAFDGQDADQTYRAIGTLQREKDDLETLRLFYVAATRAKKYLFLSGHARPTVDGRYAPASGSLLAAAWPILGDLFAAAPQSDGLSDEALPSPGQPLYRLPAGWGPPEFPASILQVSAGPRKVSERSDIKDGRRFTLRTEQGRHIGTVSHLLLERIASDGLKSWPQDRIASLRPELQLRLLAQGIPERHVGAAADRVLQGLMNAVSGHRGRWVLGSHAESANEFQLTGVLEGKLVHAIIDRTFRDARGVRWVIDYKTSEPGVEAIADFYAREVEAYRGQLTDYARLFAALEPTSDIRIALYFPMIDGWWELTD